MADKDKLAEIVKRRIEKKIIEDEAKEAKLNEASEPVLSPDEPDEGNDKGRGARRAEKARKRLRGYVSKQGRSKGGN